MTTSTFESASFSILSSESLFCKSTDMLPHEGLKSIAPKVEDGTLNSSAYTATFVTRNDCI